MSKNDIECPECGEVISFKNIMCFDNESVEIINIAYLFRCVKCDTAFVPEMRTAKEMTAKQKKEIKEMLLKEESR